MKKIGLMVFSAMLIAGCSDAPKTDSQALSGCVTIRTLSGNGSGFFARHDQRIYVFTCRHVIEDSPVIVVKDTSGRDYRVKKVLVADDRDAAVIEVELGDSTPARIFEIRQDISDLNISSEVSCFGDSEGCGVVVKCEGKMLGLGPVAIEVDAPFVQGNSGGPVVAGSDYSVLGVASMLTHLSEGNKWVKGTRFEKELRHFAIRLDNLDWGKLKESPVDAVSEDDYDSVNKQALKARLNGDIDRAIEYYSYSARNNNGDALNALAEILFAVSTNISEQAEICSLLKKSADAKCSDGMANLGICYLKGIGVERDPYEGHRLLDAAISNGCQLAVWMKGVCYRDGIGVGEDLSKAAELFESAAKNGEMHAQNDLGDYYADGTVVKENHEKAFECFMKSAMQGNSEGMRNVAICYERGFGVVSNVEESLIWMRKAAELGNDDALLSMAFKYGIGRYVAKDRAMAFRYFVKAADAGSVRALAYVGWNMIEGSGTDEDVEGGVQLLTRSASLGCSFACEKLADFYLDGYKEMQRNFDEALYWNRSGMEGWALDRRHCPGVNFNKKAEAEKISKLSRQKLKIARTAGDYYYEKKEYQKAYEWYGEGAKEDKALLRMQGNMVTWFKGWDSAVKIWQAAAAEPNGDGWAMYQMGKAYFNGWGVEKDIRTDLQWYRRSYNKGIEEAKEMIFACGGTITIKAPVERRGAVNIRNSK